MSIELKRPEEIERLSDDELLAYHDDLHSFWLAFFEGTKAMRADEITREDVFNTHAFVVDEMSARNFDHPHVDSLDAPLRKREEEPVVPALYLVPPHGEMIAKRTKTMIVKSIKFEENIGIPIYVFSDKYCWAKIVLAEPFEIDLKDFVRLRNRHRISDNERRNWWPGKRRLWAYNFQFIEAYDPPIRVDFKPGPQVWIREWKWIDEPPKEILMESGFIRIMGNLDRFKDFLLNNMPAHDIYVEAFCGRGELIWHKSPSVKEYLNDIDPEIVFMHKTVKSLTDEEFDLLKKKDWKYNKALFERLWKDYFDGKLISKVDKLYANMYLRNCKMLDGRWGGDFTPPFMAFYEGKQYDVNRILKARERFKSVEFTNDDYASAVAKFDSKETFFFLDPPYPIQKDRPRYKFHEIDVDKLANVLKDIKGKFILTIAGSKGELQPLYLANFYHMRKFWKRSRLPWKNIKRAGFYLDIFANYELRDAPKLEIVNEDAWDKLKKYSEGRRTFPNRIRHFTLLKNSEIIGYAGLNEPLRHQPGRPHDLDVKYTLRNLIVRPEFRKLGYGKKIVEAVLDYAGNDTVELLTKVPDFFEKCGFKTLGSIKLEKGKYNYMVHGNFQEVLKIENLEDYDPKKAGDAQLRDDWRIALAWHATWHRTKGRGIKFNHDEIIGALKKILRELIRRGPEVITFSPETMKKWSREAWDEITKEIKVPEDMLKEAFESLVEVTAQENFDKTKDFIFVPNFVNLIGSQVYGKENPEDQDILIRAKYDPETSEFRLPAQNLFLKIERMLGEQHWVFEPTGPNWDHVPLYDLVLCKKDSFHIERMNEEEFRRKYYISESIEKEKIKPMKRFIPMKARAGYGVGLFTDPEKAWDLWAKGIVDKSGYVITEVKYDGLRFTLHRLGRDVAILTEDMKRDRVKILPQIKDELLRLKADNFILDCEIVWWKENAPIPRHDMMAIIVGKEPLGEEDIRANIFDILYLDDKDLTDLSYEERLQYLDQLLPRDLKYLKKVERLISKNKTDFIKAHDKASEYPGSEGSMVKDPAAPYDITGKRTAAWIKIKLLMEIHAKIIGMYLKPGHWKHKGLKEPDEPIIGDRAYELFKRLQRDESTYIFRVAILRDGKLEPIMSDRKLAPADKVLRWVVDGKKDPFTGKMVEVGRGLRGEWRGTEDPKVWEMARGFPAIDPSGYAYGNTYAIRFDPPAKMGDIITVNPAVLRKFKIDEVERFSWIFPSVREIALARRKPDTAEDLERMIRIWERRQVRKATGKVIDLRGIWKKWASGVDYEWSC